MLRQASFQDEIRYKAMLAAGEAMLAAVKEEDAGAVLKVGGFLLDPGAHISHERKNDRTDDGDPIVAGDAARRSEGTGREGQEARTGER